MEIEKDKLDKNSISENEEHLIIVGETEIRDEILTTKKENQNNNFSNESLKTNKKLISEMDLFSLIVYCNNSSAF